ncbi:MAG: response regulator [Myxococcaceae bacterium]|nr:response regulator [Myxococcaceae bacterium]
MAAPLRILVIDDDESVRKLVWAVLHREGHEIVQAGSGKAGLAALEAGAFDVVLTDKNLGDISGLELIARIRTSHPTLPVVLMTGAPERITSGAMPDAYLPKPFRSLKTLVEAVDEAVEKQRIAALRRSAQERLAGLRSVLHPAPGQR